MMTRDLISAAGAVESGEYDCRQIRCKPLYRAMVASDNYAGVCGPGSRGVFSAITVASKTLYAFFCEIKRRKGGFRGYFTGIIRF